MEKQRDEFTMIELWLVKADWNRTYVGSIIRETKDGKTHLKGNADIDGIIINAEAGSEEELTDKLDAMCTEILDGKELIQN